MKGGIVGKLKNINECSKVNNSFTYKLLTVAFRIFPYQDKLYKRKSRIG